MTADEIQQQQATGFRTLRFAPPLEAAYQRASDALIRHRARLAATAGLSLFLAYAVVDLVTLPAELAHITATIRLVVTCPVIALTLWLAHRNTPDDQTFQHWYLLAYLVGGLSVVAIILAARWHSYPLPYEGMILVLMFGYFAMGLPFFAASSASAVLVSAYLLAEILAGQPPASILSNLFFLMSANIIGMVGAWVSEYRHRAHFLDRRLLELMHQSARDESQRKTELITAASHDLRQPLNVIDLTLASLPPDPRQPALRSRLRDTVDQLRNLLGTVLDSARLHEGMIRPELQHFELAHTLNELQDTWSEILFRRGMHLHIVNSEPHLAVVADPILLLRVLQNLLANAANHSGGRHIRISASREGHQIRIQVCDDGTGLPEDQRERIFEPYIRTRSGHQAGLGLGLTIVRQFTQLMNGECGTGPSAPQGATFWITLPAAITASPEHGHEPHIPCDYEHPGG